jgi:RNA polymerase sigma-70 factor, ECF subfamily
MTMVADDGQLVTSIEEVLQGLYPWARRVAYMLCRAPHDAEDLVQEAFAAALRRPPQPPTEEVLRAWLRTVLTRMHARRLRGRAREARALLRLGSWRAPHAELSHDTADVMAALRHLGAKQRACVVLYYIEDMHEDDIATVMGIAVGTVKAHLAQARAKLRTTLLS